MKQGWQRKTLGDVLKKTETINPLQSPEAEFSYIDVSSVSNETFQIIETQRLKGKDAPSRARRLIKANDVLFATVRPTLRRIAIVPDELDNQVCSTGYYVLRPKPELDHRFVFYFLFTEQFMSQMESLQKGASYPAVNDGEVRTQQIPFPPLPEQQRIVRILDEAFDSIATAKASAAKNLQNARELNKSILQGIYDTSNRNWGGRNILDICEIGDGNHGENYPKSSDMRSSGIAFIRSVNLVNGEISDEDMRFISKEKHTSLRKGHLKTGDVLFTNRGEIGKSAVVDNRYDDANLNSQIAYFRCKDNVLSWYLYYILQSSFMQNLVAESQTGTALQQLTIRQITSLQIPLPPIASQQTIISRLDAIRQETQRLESIYQRKLAALDELKKSLLHQAFTGAL